MITIVKMTASTSTKGARAATTGCFDRNLLGVSPVDGAVGPVPSRPLGAREPVFGPDAAADLVDGVWRVDGTRRLLDFDISFS
jgi:hypothetical protein